MEKVEYYWVGQKSIANLWTSIWAVDGQGVKVKTSICYSREINTTTHRSLMAI
jgi:hypothetical protein